ncbi:MAG: hypothetical protein WD607_08380 [Candidatus Paceibacterota bacterium]
MALKSGTSHAGAALLLTIISALIIRSLEKHKAFEKFFEVIEKIAGKISLVVDNSFNMYLDENLVSIVLLSSFLCFFWGVIYHKTRHA